MIAFLAQAAPAASAGLDNAWLGAIAGPLGAALALLYTWRVIVPKKDEQIEQRDARLVEKDAQIQKLNDDRLAEVKDDHERHHTALNERLDKLAVSISEMAASVHALAKAQRNGAER